MIQLQPLYATIAANGGLYTVTMLPAGSTSAAYRQGYSFDQVFAEFAGSGIPCVDFQPMDFVGYRFPSIREAHSHRWLEERYVDLAVWLEDVRRRGAIVTYL